MISLCGDVCTSACLLILHSGISRDRKQGFRCFIWIDGHLNNLKQYFSLFSQVLVDVKLEISYEQDELGHLLMHPLEVLYLLKEPAVTVLFHRIFKY